MSATSDNLSSVLGKKPLMVEGGPLDIAMPGNLLTLAAATTGAGLLGGLAGRGFASLTSPSISSIKNLRKMEEADMLGKAIDEIKARMAVNRQRNQNV